MAFVAYYRVSTAKQGKSGLGLESQRAIVNHYYPDLAAEFVEVESGKGADNRPELQAAVRMCEAGDHALVVAKVDRLSRCTEDTLALYRRLDGRLRSCDLPMVDDDPGMFKFILTIQAALAEREREIVSIRTKAALEAARARGTELGNPDNLTEDARVLGPAANVQSAREAYQTITNYVRMLRGQGLTYQQIADQLNADGYQTRTGKPFHPMTVYRILKRNGGEPD